MCILSGREDPIIFHRVIVDLTGMGGWKSLRALVLYGLLDWLLPLCIASLPFVDVHIVGAGGSNYFPSSYSGSNRGGGCEKACERFSYMVYWTVLILNLYNASMPFVDVHINCMGWRIQLFSHWVIVDLTGVEDVKKNIAYVSPPIWLIG
jgi:hypothetical protein